MFISIYTLIFNLGTSTPSAYFAVSPNSYECTESKKIN